MIDDVQHSIEKKKVVDLTGVGGNVKLTHYFCISLISLSQYCSNIKPKKADCRKLIDFCNLLHNFCQ